MKKLKIAGLIFCFLIILSADTIYSQTFPDSTADIVLGQSNFTSGSSAITQTGMNYPFDIAVDTLVYPPVLYVADLFNRRILGFRDYPFFQNGKPADFVIGQPDFTTNTAGTSAEKLNNVAGLAIDVNGNLWACDAANNRVLVFIKPTTTDYTADYVLGQGGSFTTGDPDNGGTVNDSSFNDPAEVAFDSQNRVYICDRNNNRILVFNDPLNNDFKADYVIGQSDFTSNSSSATDSTFNDAYNCFISPDDDLYVSDYSNHRILKFTDPINTDFKADQVFGQGGSYTTGSTNNPSRNAESLYQPANLFMDNLGRLYVNDNVNHRLLAFDTPLDTTADYVYGQGGIFTTASVNLTAEGLQYPRGVWVDRDGNIITTGDSYHRVLIFKNPRVGLADANMSEISFGSVDTSALDTISLKIRNRGVDSLYIDSVFIFSTGTGSSADFTVLDSVDTVESAVPDSMMLRMVFSPDSMISYSDSVIIYYRKSVGSSTDTLIYDLSGRGFMYGDISGDYNITSYDASLILQYNVDLITFAGDTLLRADVSGNSEIGAFDASYVLRYAAGLLNVFPVGVPKSVFAVSGEAEVRYAGEYNKNENTYSVPVMLKNAAGIFSMELKLEYGDLNFTGFSTGTNIEGFLTEISLKDGILKFSMAGSEPVSEDGAVAIFNFNVPYDKTAENVRLTKLVLNESDYDISSLDPPDIVPKNFKLYQNFPNPFNPVTTIKYDIPETGRVKMKIYNVIGQVVKTLVDDNKKAGRYKLQWKGLNDNYRAVASGVYFYRIIYEPEKNTAGKRIVTKKLVYLK